MWTTVSRYCAALQRAQAIRYNVAITRGSDLEPSHRAAGGQEEEWVSSANKWPCAATSLMKAQPLYCHHPITNHHVPDSHRGLGPRRMTSEVETCHTDVPQTKTKQRLCCRIENWKLSSEGVIICKQRFNLSICSISELLESVTITTAATLHWAAPVSGTLETVSCWIAGIHYV